MVLSYCKKLPAYFWEIASRNNGDSYCLNCLQSFRTENKHTENDNVN